MAKRSSKLIHIVENDVELTQQLASQIEHFGYQTRLLNSPYLLEKAASEALPDAIISDMVFPDIDLAVSQEPIKFLKQLSKKPPIIFASPREDLKTRLAAVRAGGSAYLTKPIDIRALIDSLDALMFDPIPEPYRVLIVDDSVAEADFYGTTLQMAGVLTHIVTDPMQVLDALNEFNPELILMDMYMPTCSGDELAKVIRQQEAFVSIPIVFLSGETDINKQLATFKLGVDDFLTKPIKSEYLVSSVISRTLRHRILRSYISRDSLTGLLNHTKIQEQLDVEIARAKRQNCPLVFAMIDIDNFKSVNDTYGHPVGDRVIQSLSTMLRQRLRRTDVIGRYGGEEFALVLYEIDGPTATKIVDEIRERFSRVKQYAGDKQFFATLSCGIAEYPSFATSNELTEAADKALYEAKRLGRNKIVLAATAAKTEEE